MRVARFMLAGALLALVVFAPFPGHTRLFRALHNSAHAPAFGLIAVFALTWLRSHRMSAAWRPARQYIAALAIAASFGLITELLQIPAGRDASLHDVRNDVLGAAAFLAAFAALANGTSRLAPRSLLLAFAFVAMGFAMLPVFRAAVEQVRRESQFPVVADFVRRMDRYYIGEESSTIERATLPSTWSTAEGEQALHVVFQNGSWPGINFYELSSDWSGYASLALDLTNPTDAALKLAVRIHDRPHTHQLEDRFNGRYEIPARTRTVLRIPLAEVRKAPAGREMKMEEVAGLILFRTQDSAAGEMYLSRVWLE